jgi:hypothetical protein
VTIRSQTPAQKKATLKRTLKAFVGFCKLFGFELYAYQVKIAYWCLYSLLVEPIDIYIKISRQAGKTETITLLLRFLIIFYRLLVGDPLMAGIASPKGEQAKTDVDRIKKSIGTMRDSWQVEDREFNANTVRAYRLDQLFAEVYRFSLAPTTTNESKTLNVLIVEEAHKADDQKRADQLDPMLASTNGVRWMIGVGARRMCDFKRGCDGDFPNSRSIVVDVDAVIADRRKKYEQTSDPKHLDYEKTFARLLKEKGRDNPEIRVNFYLDDLIEEGNFVSRERLLSCGRGKDVVVPAGKLFLGIDWGRVSDSTWAVVGNEQNDVVDMLKLPSVAYEEQIELLKAWLNEKRTEKVVKDNGAEETVEFTYLQRILGVCGDSTGQGDMPMETLEDRTRLPVDESSHVKFTLQSKNEMYLLFEEAIFRDVGDPLRFSYPADHPLAAEFEDQMTQLVREYKGDGEYLSVHHPDEPGAKDDAPDGSALMLKAAKNYTANKPQMFVFD